jgi:hypothetical protein
MPANSRLLIFWIAIAAEAEAEADSTWTELTFMFCSLNLAWTPALLLIESAIAPLKENSYIDQLA